MKITLAQIPRQRHSGGWALLAVMTLTAAGLLVLSSVIAWSNANSAQDARASEFTATSYAAEAATEKVLSAVSQDYQNYGESVVYPQLSTYASKIPSTSDSSYWTNYQFSGGGTANQIIVTRISQSNSIVLGAPYAGLTLLASTYEIIANAQNPHTLYGITSTVGQQINLGTIPIFQFAIFYQGDMEVDPGPVMNIGGLVHGNANIYMQPQSPLTFSNEVSAVQNIVLGEDPLDPTVRTPSTVTFDSGHLSDAIPLNLPVGTNTTGTVTNTSANVYAILQVPPAGESPTSGVGTNRLYNQADMIIVISNGNSVTVTSGVDVNNQTTVISNNAWSLFLKTNDTLYNQRESMPVDAVDLDVGKLRSWSATNTTLRSALGGRDLDSVYIADMRSTSNAIITTNAVVGTNITYVTTNVVTLNDPSSGTYLGSVSSTTLGTNSPPPAPAQPPALNVTTNTTATNTVFYPTAGTYLGLLTTNTVSTNTSFYPSAGNYIGSITTNTASSNNVPAYPSAGKYTGSVSTNTVSTNTISYPSGGTYLGGVSTNTASTNTLSYPSAGSYIGSVTTNTTASNNVPTHPSAGQYIGLITTNTTATNSFSYPTAGTYLGSVSTNTTASNNVPAYPAAGHYIGAVTTNTTATNSVGFPSGNYIGPVTTNTAYSNAVANLPSGPIIGSVTTNQSQNTTTSYPSPGTYAGSVTTNTQSTTTSSYPSPGTYTGTVTTNWNFNHTKINNYTYNEITGYTWKTVPTYSYTALLNYSYFYASGYTYTALLGYGYSLITSYSYTAFLGYGYTAITGYGYSAITGYTYTAITGYSYTAITGYGYNLITSYSYSLPAYAYALITGTNYTVVTNYYYITNWNIYAESGVVLTNGSTLPTLGLAVATPNPAYVVGNWNVSTNGSTMYTGTSDTSHTYPSAIFADAINILSPAWNSANSSNSLSARVATADTVNAAFLTGNVPSNGSYYSGGVENFPRFLEDWSSVTFTYNGSMVAMFSSTMETAPWGSNNNTYNPPATRQWAFDKNFNNPAKVPPLTPRVTYVNRAGWTMLAPNTTQF